MSIDPTVALTLTDFAEWLRPSVWLVHIDTIAAVEFGTNLLLVSVYWAYLILRVYGVYARSKSPLITSASSNNSQINGLWPPALIFLP